MRENNFTASLVYVDDVVMVGNDTITIHQVKHHLDSVFHIKDLGVLKYFLSMEVAHNKEDIAFNQWKYALDLLEEVGFLNAQPASFPIESRHNLAANIYDPVSDVG